MKVKNNNAKIKNTACFLGVVQGLTYAIMALICIILYTTASPSFDRGTHMGVVNYYMYVLYLGPNFPTFVNQTMIPKTFNGFVWVYFIFHLLWIYISTEIVMNKMFPLKQSLKYWSFLTFAVSIWDLITVVILGADYAKCLSWVDNDVWFGDKVYSQGSCASGILPVLVIAARGFVLWIVNVIFGILLLKMSGREKGLVYNRAIEVTEPYYIYPLPPSVMNARNHQYHPPPSPSINTRGPVAIPYPDYD